MLISDPFIDENNMVPIQQILRELPFRENIDEDLKTKIVLLSAQHIDSLEEIRNYIVTVINNLNKVMILDFKENKELFNTSIEQLKVIAGSFYMMEKVDADNIQKKTKRTDK